MYQNKGTAVRLLFFLDTMFCELFSNQPISKKTHTKTHTQKKKQKKKKKKKKKNMHLINLCDVVHV